MKTSELKGVFLDYWVAKADGYEPWAGATYPKGDFMWKAQREIGPAAGWLSHRFSADWSLAGPIIEREKIELQFDARDYGGWFASLSGKTFGQTGPTPLIAVMRAYVASKFGDEVLDPKDIRNEP